MIRRALLSVSDKTGLVEFARELHSLGVELVSTGGTQRVLVEHGIPVKAVEEVTGFPEMMDGRVKTLHPKVHGGLLARRDLADHLAQMVQHQIEPIDLVVCNLYPFAQTVARESCTLEEAVENIDIGGPSMVRSAAKNHAAVTVIVNPVRYGEVLESLKANGEVPLSLRQRLALEAFRHTARYDSMIAEYLGKQYSPEELFPDSLTLTFDKCQSLRYGENPHQSAAFYRDHTYQGPSLANARQLQGKELSYCNINDADAALAIVSEFAEPAAVAVKHTNPCGVACGSDLLTAYQRAYAADPVSIYGGIVALNREVDEATAQLLKQIFLDIVIAPAFSAEALQVLGSKKNLRLLAVGDLPYPPQAAGLYYQRVVGGLLVQTRDTVQPEEEPWRTVTKATPGEQALADLRFASKVMKHCKSNAIVVAKDGVTLGIGVGQVNRIDAARYALAHAGEAAKGAVLASEALLPFADVIEAAGEAAIAAVVQPGGAIRDADSIAMADKYGIAMVFTGHRHFRH